MTQNEIFKLEREFTGKVEKMRGQLRDNLSSDLKTQTERYEGDI